MKQDSRCFIFAAGSFYGLQTKPTADDLVIAADGGYRWCQQEKIIPQLLLGDFDSLTTIPKEIPTNYYPPEKDDTDTMLAIKTGLSQGYKEFHLYGCSGGRLDHTLANLQGLCYLASKGARGFLYTEQETFTAIKDERLLLPAKKEGTFSVFCFGADAEGVTIEGAQYPLLGATLSAHFPLGVSNHWVGHAVSVQVEKGCLLIGWQQDM